MSKDNIVFFDTEIAGGNNRLYDIGAVKDDATKLHTGIYAQFLDFISNSQYLCGHNIFAHDLKYIKDEIVSTGNSYRYIDTLLFSPLVFPLEKYHHLGKEEKIDETEENNPLFDALKARDRFYEEVTAFYALPEEMQIIFYLLLGSQEHYCAFFEFLNYSATGIAQEMIRKVFDNKICINANIDELVKSYPVEMAYCLALIEKDNEFADLCPWLIENFPNIRLVMQFLRSVPCKDEGCSYCRRVLSIHAALKYFFDFDEFRTYEGEPLQERAVQAAVDGHSLLAVFPTGGGKSLTFQIPALMAGVSVKGLTVVISPLQSLMKDQVDNLEEKSITKSGVDSIAIKMIIQNTSFLKIYMFLRKILFQFQNWQEDYLYTLIEN